MYKLAIGILFFVSTWANGSSLLNDLTSQMEVELEIYQNVYIKNSHKNNGNIKQYRNKFWQPDYTDAEYYGGCGGGIGSSQPIVENFYRLQYFVQSESWTPILNNYKKHPYWVVSL